MCAYEWPGNVRELRNIIERMLVLHGKSKLVTPENLPEEFFGNGSPPVNLHAQSGERSLADAVNAFERHMIERALDEADGVQTRAAEALGTTRRILKYRMEKLKIQFRKEEVSVV
jgi:transcriptional regulator with PAS, ATPase and Fis domain